MKRKLAFSFIISCIFIVSISTIVSARYLSYGWPDATIPYKPYDDYLNSTWEEMLDDSIANWNFANADIAFLTSLTTDNEINPDQYAYEDYGRCYSTYSGDELKEFEIEINARTILEDADNLNNFTISVAVHELGHTIWLADNPNTTSSSIMKYTRDRNTMTEPQTYDINNVKAKY